MRSRFHSILVIVLLLTLLSGCGAATPASPDSNKRDENVGKTPPYEIKLVFYSSPQKDFKQIEEEMSKITLEKINATVKLERIEPAAWDQQTILMLTGPEQVDLIVTGNQSFWRQVAQKQLLPLDELIKNRGQDIIKAFEPEILNAAKVEGNLYAVPTIRDFASNVNVYMRKDLLDKYNLDLSTVKELDDLDPFFAAIKKNEASITPLVKSVAPKAIINRVIDNQWDVLGDSVGVLENLDKLKVVNLYETPEYEKLIKTVRRWYEAGYISKDVSTSKDAAADLIKAKTAFGSIQKGKPGAHAQIESRVNLKLESVDIGRQITSTTNVTAAMLGIPKNSKDPQRAMMFLNLLYSDSKLMNLISWGIEGKHYVKINDKQIDFPPGVDASNSGYNSRQGWMFGNQLLTYTWSTDSPNLWEDMDKFNRESKKSIALGFTYNPAPVKTELAAITNVVRQYQDGLENGSLDPKANLPKFNAALRAAGIDKVIAEKQKQLDEWAAKNK
ncbi:extracellular solute-binding protein [Paenibacillus sp. LMG 31456]|uniref:Extracellular solute-binding protein n=1 Tax=Paenibacillus foliorum TaxID=2654974 RepID=A0A972JY28_9BACL|nr:ABC transporter substrate-binding protein [Paenibacillus foliorum]NOU93099.1 extracellular solute-binding protein [Paenibacillus foliorum]